MRWWQQNPFAYYTKSKIDTQSVAAKKHAQKYAIFRCTSALQKGVKTMAFLVRYFLKLQLCIQMSLYRRRALAFCKLPRADTCLDFYLWSLGYSCHWCLCCCSPATGCSLRLLAAKLIRAVSHLLTAPYGQRTGSGGHKQSLAARRRNVDGKPSIAQLAKPLAVWSRLILTMIVVREFAYISVKERDLKNWVWACLLFFTAKKTLNANERLSKEGFSYRNLLNLIY